MNRLDSLDDDAATVLLDAPDDDDAPRSHRRRRLVAAALIAAALVGEFAWLSRSRDPLAAERQAVAALDDAAKADLARRWTRFQELPTEQQRQLRSLHDTLEADDDPDALRRTLADYQQWKSGLSPVQSATLVNLDPTARLARVREFAAQQSAAAARHLSDDDAKKITAWLERQVETFEDKLLEVMPGDMRKRFEGLERRQRNWALIMSLVAYRSAAGPGAGPRLENIPAQSVAALRDELSPQAQQVWDAAGPDERKQLLGDWIRQAVFRAMPQREGFASRVDDQKLRDFFDHELTEAERNHYTALPREEMMSQLRRDYMRRKGLWKEPGPGDWSFGRGPFGRPGGGGPGGGPNDRGPNDRGVNDRVPGERGGGERRPSPLPNSGPRNGPPPFNSPPP